MEKIITIKLKVNFSANPIKAAIIERMIKKQMDSVLKDIKIQLLKIDIK